MDSGKDFRSGSPEGERRTRLGKGRRFVLPMFFLGVFALVGAAASVVVVIDFLQAVSTYFWDETVCTIESSSVAERPAADEFELFVTYRYQARGDTYLGDRVRHGYTGSGSAAKAYRMAERYAVGESVPCWVDPDEPGEAFLQRANLWRGFLIFIPLVFVAIGLGGIYALRDGWAFSNRSADKPGPAAAKPIRAGILMSVLFGAFFLMGFGTFVPFFVWPTMKVVEARSWLPVECEIVSSGVRSHPGEDSTTYSVEAVYRYRIGGREYTSNRYRFMGGSSSGYESKAEAAARIPAGSVAECWVDPDDPYEAVIDRGFALDFLFGLIPLVFGLIGAGGLGFVIWMKRGARKLAGRPSPKAVLETYRTGPTELEPDLGPLAKLGCATCIALFWNGIVSVFVWQLISGWRTGNTDWFLAIFLTPFVLIGLLLLSSVPYSILALLNPRPSVRLSSSKLTPGETAQLDWSFRGAAGRIQHLKIWLECSKKETRTVETPTSLSTSTTSESVRKIDILDRGEGYPLAFGTVSFRVPADAQPTSSGDDAYSWKLHFHGRIDYWPDAVETFDVTVADAENRA